MTVAEVALRTDMAVYACADFLLVEGLCGIVAGCFLIRVAEHFNEDWFPEVLQDFCIDIRADNQIIRAPTFKLLLDRFDLLKDRALEKIIEKQEPIAWYVATKLNDTITGLSHECDTLNGRISQAKSKCIVLENAAYKAMQMAKVVGELVRFVDEVEPKCKYCKANMKTNLKRFNLYTSDVDADNIKVDPPKYYVTCQQKCGYRQYLE